MILLLKYNNKTNICFVNGEFIFNVFILWFRLFCGFCALISVGVIWFVIWWASGFLLQFDFGCGGGRDLILAGFQQWCMVEGDELEKLRPWRFRKRAWWSTMVHGVTWVKAERGWKGNRGDPRHFGGLRRELKVRSFLYLYIN